MMGGGCVLAIELGGATIHPGRAITNASFDFSALIRDKSFLMLADV